MPIDKRWIDTMERGIKDSTWDAYDNIIKSEVGAYEKKFPALKTKVNWLLLKALLWSESGGPSNSAWKTRTMQIGNIGDAGYGVLKSKSEGSDLIMNDALKKAVASDSIHTPVLNIKAAIAYLYTRMARSNIQSVMDIKDVKIYEYTVVTGDNLDKISKNMATTTFELKRLNPAASGFIQPGQKLKYHKAKMKRVITGWLEFNTQNISDRYNGGGDKLYTEKLTYILDKIFPVLVRTNNP